MSKLSIKVVSATFRVYCACGSTMSVTGTMDGIQAAVKLWSQDHHGKECAPMTAAEYRASKKKEAYARRVNKILTRRALTKQEKIRREQKAMTPLFEVNS